MEAATTLVPSLPVRRLLAGGASFSDSDEDEDEESGSESESDESEELEAAEEAGLAFNFDFFVTFTVAPESLSELESESEDSEEEVAFASVVDFAFVSTLDLGFPTESEFVSESELDSESGCSLGAPVSLRNQANASLHRLTGQRRSYGGNSIYVLQGYVSASVQGFSINTAPQHSANEVVGVCCCES